MSIVIPIIGNQFADAVIRLIDSAEDSIKVIVYDWRHYPLSHGGSVSQFNEAVFRAAKRGVKVQVLTNNDQMIFFLKNSGCEAKRLYSSKLLHTKMLLIDDIRLVIGSHNYTQHAFTMNEEASVCVEFENEDNQFVKYFKNLWSV